MKPPSFLSAPAFVVGMPIVFAISRLSLVMPKALLREKLRPGIPVFVAMSFCICSYLMHSKRKSKQKKYKNFSYARIYK